MVGKTAFIATMLSCLWAGGAMAQCAGCKADFNRDDRNRTNGYSEGYKAGREAGIEDGRHIPPVPKGDSFIQKTPPNFSGGRRGN